MKQINFVLTNLNRCAHWVFASKIRVALLIILIITSGYFYIKNINNSENVEIQTATVTKGTIVSSVSASGSVVTANIEEVNTKVSGTVKEVYVQDGQSVVKGQKIASIELDQVGQENYLSAYSSYLNASKAVNSANNNYRSTQASLAVIYEEVKGHDNDESFEMKEKRTKAEVANDNAYDSLQTSQVQLSAATVAYQQENPLIVAPSSGIIKNITLTEGLKIGSSSTAENSGTIRVATISKEGKPIVSVNISEIDVPQVSVGQKTTVTFDSISDKTFTGTVVTIDKLGSTTSNVTTYPALIQLDTNSEQILTNMAATAEIITATKSNVIILPSSAVSTQNGQSTVTILKNEIQINTVVETGISSDTNTEITSGLSEGDVVVTGTTTSAQDVQFGNNSAFGGAFGGSGGGGSAVRMVR